MTKRKRPKIESKIASSIEHEQQEALLNQLREKNKKVRFTMDISSDLHRHITRIAKDRGQTIKGYFLTLAKKDINEMQ